MPRLTKLQRKHNQERINRAAEIIQGYKGRVTGEDAATCLRDLLTDLMHFAKSRHLSIEAEFVADASISTTKSAGGGRCQNRTIRQGQKEEYNQWAASTKFTAASRCSARTKSTCFWRRCASD